VSSYVITLPPLLKHARKLFILSLKWSFRR